MGTNDRRLAVERLKVRAEMRSINEEEDTGVVNVRAEERVAKASESPPKDSIARQLVYVLNALPPWSRPIVLIVLVLVFAGSGWSLASLTGIVK